MTFVVLIPLVRSTSVMVKSTTKQTKCPSTRAFHFRILQLELQAHNIATILELFRFTYRTSFKKWHKKQSGNQINISFFSKKLLLFVFKLLDGHKLLLEYMLIFFRCNNFFKRSRCSTMRSYYTFSSAGSLLPVERMLKKQTTRLFISLGS